MAAITSWLTVDDLEFQVAPNLDMHIQALLWALSTIVLGFLVLAFDTRDYGQTRRGMRIRDHILGIEQRYFLIVLNGILLYAALVVKIQKMPPVMIVPR